MSFEQTTNDLESQWLQREHLADLKAGDYQEQLDLCGNQVPEWFRGQFDTPATLVEADHGVAYAVREFYNQSKDAEHIDEEPLAPVLFFTHWGCALNGERGLLDTYGVLQTLEANRPLITVELPGHGEASPASWRWLRGVTYERIGTEIKTTIDTYSEARNGFEQVYIAGISSGGNVATATAAAFKQRVSAVVVVSAPGDSRIPLPRFAHGSAAVEMGHLRQGTESAPSEIKQRIEEIESSEINSQEKAFTTKVLLFGRLAVGMARGDLEANISRLHPETQLHIFCGSKEAIADWKKQLEIVRTRSGVASLHVLGSATHASLALNRLEPTTQIGYTIRRIDHTLGDRN